MLSILCGHCLPSCQAERQAPGLLVYDMMVMRHALVLICCDMGLSVYVSYVYDVRNINVIWCDANCM